MKTKVAIFSLVLACCLWPISFGRADDVLAIGDSIRQGWSFYLPFDMAKENCGSTRLAMSPGGSSRWNITKWQQDRQWTAIIFNFGLHDISEGVPIDEYKRNLEWIVDHLAAERIYFCTTTPGRVHDKPVQPGLVLRTEAKVAAYNAASLEVMLRHHVTVIDLHRLCIDHPEWWNGPTDVHYTDEAYKQMAKYIREAITAQKR